MEELARVEWTRVVGWLIGKGLIRETAEDIAQEAFLALWRRRELIGDYPIRKALYITARNKWIDHWRGETRLKRRVACVPLDEVITSVDKDFTEAIDDAVAVSEIIGGLSFVQRSVLEKVAKGWDYPKIAAELRIPLGTVKRRVFDAKQKLRDRMAV